MKMVITSMEFSNIRKFPNLKLQFTDAQNKLYKNSFIMMGNGTGKTTTITLIKGLLDGTAVSQWNNETVRSFSPIFGSASEGSFKLSVQFDDKTYIYILNLNYETGKATIYCTTAAQGGLGPRRFPSALAGLFTEEFVHRFVFDGEQAAKVMDNKSNEAEEAIKYLYRLDMLEEISRINYNILTAIQDAEGGSAGTKRSVNNLRTRQDKVKDTIVRLRQRLKVLNTNIEEKKIQKGELDGRITKIDEKYRALNKEKIETTNRRDQLRGSIDLDISQILSAIKSPYLVSQTLCSRMYEFGDNMTKLKLPKNISRDFFNELANEQTCICGRDIGDKERDTIQRNADHYLGSDQQSVLNSIKSSLMNSVYNNSLEQFFEELNSDIIEFKLVEDNLLDVEDRLAKAGGEEAVRLRQDRDLLLEEIGHLDEERKTIESKDDSNSFLTEDNNLIKAIQASDDLEIKIASATRTNDALRRKEIVEDLINQIQGEASHRLKHEIIKKTNDKLRSVITDDIIEIDSIDKYIQLKGKTGASEGQTLSIAYCFLGTMFEDSELQFPFVIDSPAGKMDYEKRRAVANILPTLFNQLIAFVTSAEVEQFADQFYTAPNTQFTTIIANPSLETVEIHPGKDYFDSYQREHKEEDA